MNDSLIKGKPLQGNVSFLKLVQKYKNNNLQNAAHLKEPVKQDNGLVEYITKKRKKLMEEFNRLEMRIREIEKRRAKKSKTKSIW
ncbi:MAG: hypothetical protein ACOCZQ_02070 [Nanoarchaeota archaeon]